MNASGHRQAGFLAGVGLGLGVGLPGWQALAAGSLATLTAGGRLSPDIDQHGLYRLLLPRPLEGHRRLSHWWGWPALAGLLLALAVWTAGTAAWWWLPAAALVTGWASHIAVDFVFGASSRYRGAGVPMSPTGGHRGVGLHSDGLIAQLCTRLVFPGLIGWAVVVCLVTW